MTVENQDTNNSETNSETNVTANQADSDVLNKLVEERISENLKPIKEKLDSAYSQRDEALKRLAEYERKEKEAELKRLEEEGKHREAFEMRLAEERAAREALERRNVELTRDIEVRNALSAYQFRNENATEMAYREVVSQLVRNEQNVWVHKSGLSIRDYIKTFSESDENPFFSNLKYQVEQAVLQQLQWSLLVIIQRNHYLSYHKMRF